MVAIGFYIIFLMINLSSTFKDWSEDKNPQKWNKYAFDKIQDSMRKKINGNIAKNIILFLGDGMGISTLTAGRIRKGQLKGLNGEEVVTYMESLPHVGLSKTYNIDAQTADSAGTATAFLSGIKTRIGFIGLDGRATDCLSSKYSQLESILKWAYFAGKSTGIVTTTRVTHATPAACYANSYDRSWETFDGVSFNQTIQNLGCKDIAAQLIEDNSYINLIMGGGRKNFIKKTEQDFFSKKMGSRVDNRNLIEEWNNQMETKKLRHKFVWNLTDFEQLRPNQYDHILALLNYDHLDFESDRIEKQPIVEPSLVEMTDKAIELLSVNPNGFFLLVEGGKIDHGHHIGMAQRAIDEFVTFDEAVGRGLQKTNENDTLIVTTADHSHVFTIGGYSLRGNSLFGINLNGKSNISGVNLTFTALLYGNGPGNLNSVRNYNLTSEKTGGEDVPIFASGPMSYLFDATFEQNYIAHVMAYSACIGPYNLTNYPKCLQNRGVPIVSNAIINYYTNTFLIVACLFFAFLMS